MVSLFQSMCIFICFFRCARLGSRRRRRALAVRAPRRARPCSRRVAVPPAAVCVGWRRRRAAALVAPPAQAALPTRREQRRQRRAVPTLAYARALSLSLLVFFGERSSRRVLCSPCLGVGALSSSPASDVGLFPNTLPPRLSLPRVVCVASSPPPPRRHFGRRLGRARRGLPARLRLVLDAAPRARRGLRRRRRPDLRPRPKHRAARFAG
jgi:hypothetical protein